MFDRRRHKVTFLMIGLVVVVLMLYVSYFRGPAHTPQTDGHLLSAGAYFDAAAVVRDYDFDVEEDVLVFLHMQKTGGTTFGKHLILDLNTQVPCDCKHATNERGKVRLKNRCQCVNSNKNVWLFSRYSTGWKCGLHADWTELKDCVAPYLDSHSNTLNSKRRYLYITILREPVRRYLSEWRHVQRGATWLAASLRCDGRSATLEEVPFCFSGEDWGGVTLAEFTACEHNLANNRQTRMLANLSQLHCYNRTALPSTERSARMLESAKQNLRDMAFFGLTEYQQETQYMFERTFHVKFLQDFETHETRAAEVDMAQEDLQKVVHNNQLDIELYQYAKELFLKRLEKMKSDDTGLISSSVNYAHITEAHTLGDKAGIPAVKDSSRTLYVEDEKGSMNLLSTHSSEDTDSHDLTEHVRDRERRASIHLRPSRRRHS